jgi:pyruvate dehydrogenase E2 component (dihydrolipoamide acetyltransferase)
MSEPSIAAPIVMPKLGLTMSEGLIAEWLVKPGDAVRAGQILFVVETDKISNEIEAPADGTIVALLAHVGETVAVGAPVATWTGPAKSQGVVSAQPDQYAAKTPALAPVALPVSPQTVRVLCTPYARRLAMQGGIDIAMVSGSGARGRIRSRDILAALAAQPATVDSAPPAPARDMRALIAARVSRSNTEIPQFYVTADARFDALAALRQDLNAVPNTSQKLSVTAFLGVAASRALALHPEANVVWREGRALPLARRTIGIAVETPRGVMAPVIPAESDIYDFAASLDAAVTRARQGRLGHDDVGEAAIGISNVGMFGVRSLLPIVDPDQSFMLGVGAPQSVIRPDGGGKPVALQEITLSLACDHRAIDGAGAARFLATIVTLIEQPIRLLIAHR